jgi:cation diffusion facilitator family transporter
MTTNMDDSTTSEKAKELFVLRISTILTVIYAVIGIFIAILSDSLTLFVDALHSVVDVVVSVLAIFVVRKIQEPPNPHYNYGYAKYEPFMTAVDGLLIMAICAGSIVGSVQDIVHPEPVKHVEAIIIYSFISIFICIGFGLYMKSIGDRISSELLKADSQLWIIEGIVSAGVCLAFAVSDVISYSVWSGYANYVDPIMSIILCLGLLYEPLKIVWGSFQDLVDARPDDEANERIEAVVHRMAEKYYLLGVAWIKTRKAGRKRFLTVCYKIEPTRNIKEMEEIRNDMENEVRQTAPEMDVDVHFRS